MEEHDYSMISSAVKGMVEIEKTLTHLNTYYGV
jgi:hypothetical protein